MFRKILKCTMALTGALLCLLTGCGKATEPDQQALEFRTALMEAGGCCFSADVTAFWDERVYSFSLRCAVSDGEATLELTAPENIAGLRAVAREGSARLEYDGASLELGSLANGTVPPVAAPWLLVECWRGEYIAWAGMDGDRHRVTYLRGYDEEELTMDTWFDQGVPVYAEVAWGGAKCLSVTIMDYQMTDEEITNEAAETNLG